jgi:hypothetical protein
MAYSDFTLDGVRRAFALILDERGDLFAMVPDHAISPLLRTLLEENVPLALAITRKRPVRNSS